MWKRTEEVQPFEAGQMNVEKHHVYGLLLQSLVRFVCIYTSAYKVQPRHLSDVIFEHAGCKRLVFD